MRKTGGFLAALSFVFLAVTACTPGVQPLLDEYNALFGEDVALAGGGGTQEKDGGWLQPTYDVPATNTLNLHAPQHCTDYTWKLEPYPGIVPEVPLPQDFDIEKYIGKDSRSWLRLDLKAAKIKSGTYLLTSTAVRDGQTLKCTSKVTVQEADAASGKEGGTS